MSLDAPMPDLMSTVHNALAKHLSCVLDPLLLLLLLLLTVHGLSTASKTKNPTREP